ncbi:glycosyltransferase [Cupriavidus consociatus]|uniref:glycosyltransferase n=1 Tax=Cupriavidus consociatus TaxID=2821357 RepID=UPI001FD7AE43|nr:MULTISPECIES: glycosyltransferase [unclassified Cupriavidus]MDK2660247.1 glycosyltransferase [Cupriavidus sp. LEh21]
MEQRQHGKHSGPMRIMLLVTCLQLGGAEQQVAALAREYVALGHRVSVVSLLPGNEVALPEGVETVMLTMRKTPLSLLEALMRVRRFVLQWRPDVVHAHMIHANLFARMLTRVCPVPATICTAHSVFQGGALRMLAYRLTDRWSDLTTHVSAEGRQIMIETRAAPGQRIIVVPNGIDTARYRPHAQARSAARAALGLHGDERLILNVGRLVWEKAQTDLIDAFAQLSPAAGTMLMIAGDGPLRDTLAQCIAGHGLGGRVRLLGRRHDVPALLNAADLFVLSSRVEGMPLVVGEALACGCPVVATDAAGVAPMVDGVGTVVPRGDPAALARAMRDALLPGRGAAADEAARHRHIDSAFSIEAIARTWLRLYADCTRTGAASHPASALPRRTDRETSRSAGARSGRRPAFWPPR